MIYFDHSATTPVDPRVLKKMLPYFDKNFGNASSLHTFGQNAILGVDEARKKSADFLGCASEEIVFTSGSTEANNLVLRGLVKAAKKAGLKNPHIVTSKIEHDAILEPCRDLEDENVEISYLPVDSQGQVNVADVEKAIKDNTILVSIMYVNSEVGIIEPIREIGKLIKKINEKRYSDWQKRGSQKNESKPRAVYFHTDATQAVNFLDCNVERLHVDSLSLSGHKIYGPKGVGLLYIKAGTKISPIQLGGHHERNLRSGTLNVPGIVGLGEALALITSKNCEKNNKKIASLRDLLVAEIFKNIPNVSLTTDREKAVSSHAHFLFSGAEGESILISLDFAGVAVSTGSACASGSLQSSPVLLAMGIPEEDAHYAVRFTLGKNNTREEINKVTKILPGIIKRLRDMNPVYKK